MWTILDNKTAQGIAVGSLSVKACKYSHTAKNIIERYEHSGSDVMTSNNNKTRKDNCKSHDKSTDMKSWLKVMLGKN